MQQFSVRLSDERATAMRRLAGARGRSINQTFEDLVAAATDPHHADSEADRLRERLARAGLSVELSALPDVVMPDEDALRRARAAAGRGTPLSQIISEQRR